MAALLALIVLGGGAVGLRRWQVAADRAAVAAIRDAGGVVQGAWEYRFLAEPGRAIDEANRPEADNVHEDPAWPSWIRQGLGDDFFARPTAANLPRQADPDLIASAVARLSTLELLGIPDGARLRGGLGPLRALGSLRGLYLDGGGLGPDDLAAVAAIPDLRLLAVGPARGSGTLGDADLAPLRGAARLEAFRLAREPGVTDAGMAALVAGWPELAEFTWLDVGHPVPATIRALAEHQPRLRRLSLGGATFADADLAPLGRMAGLVAVRLEGTGLTDAALGHLAGHRQLAALAATNVEVRGDGLKALASLGDLSSLGLPGLVLGAASLADIPALPALAELDLAGVAASPAGWASLAARHGLRTLLLGNSNLDDATLPALDPLKATLRLLDIANTRVTVEAAAAFRAEAPPRFFLIGQRPAGSAGGR